MCQFVVFQLSFGKSQNNVCDDALQHSEIYALSGSKTVREADRLVNIPAVEYTFPLTSLGV